MTTAENVALARRGFDAMLRGDREAIGEILAPDVKWHAGDPSAEGSCQNREQALEFIGRAMEHGPAAELVDVIGAEDVVVVIMKRRPASDATPPHANLSRFRDGKVIEMVHYPEASKALVAAGLQ